MADQNGAQVFFTKLARIIAVIMLFACTFRLVLGFYVASIDDPVERAAVAARYLGRFTSGEAIDRGFYGLILAVALGVLVEISSSLRK